jgi:hypothetical protein
MNQSTQKKKPVSYKNDNLLEAIGSIPSSIGSNTIAEFGKIGGDIASVLLGSNPKSGEMRPNQAIEFGAQPEAAPQTQVFHTETQHKPNATQIEQETRQQLQAVRAELASLAKSLKNLHQEVQTAIAQEPVDPGIYHLNFYEQLRSFMQVLRQQIEDSRTWLSTFNSRKKKLGYWGMYKKHGTTFGLSNERSLATAAG